MKDMSYVREALDKMSEKDTAWLAGFYEGEGSCGFYVSKTRSRTKGHLSRRIIMSIAQNEREVLDDIVKIVGYGHVATQTILRKSTRPCSRFECSGLRAYLLLKKLLPYMRSPYKIGQAERALISWESRPQYVENLEHRPSLTKSRLATARKALFTKRVRELW